MKITSQPTLLEEVLTAHGGLKHWNRVASLDFRIRFTGRILAMKFKSPFLRHLRGQVDARQVRSQFEDFPRAGVRGVFTPDRVWLETTDGVIFNERDVSRDPTGKVLRRMIWDDLDLLYFLGYAAWNYLCTPFLFLLPGFQCREGEPWHEVDGSMWRHLHVTYPLGFPTHCREQSFFFAADGLLRRLDYTAEIFSPFAHGAHYCEDHKCYDGLVFPTYRRVFMRNPLGRPIRQVALVEGRVDNITAYWQTPQPISTTTQHNEEMTI